ncbi:MAG: helix-turn-helix domain-containing protein [Streptosporangiales bacterium]|nr:helix-turn-helix domain-containing protein [Streptosporangiales bacterium]
MDAHRRSSTPPSGTTSAIRVADILLLFLHDTAGIGITDAARRLDLSKAVVHRILQSLEARAFVRFDNSSRRYVLGPAVSALGAQALRRTDLRPAAMPVLRRLQQVTGETSTVSALVGAHRVYLDQVVSLAEIKMTVEIGRAWPLHAGSSSRAILAFAPPELREQVLAGELPRLTPITITDRATLEADLQQDRARGVSVSRGERQPGAASLAAPVLGPEGTAVGSVSVCGPADRFTDEVIARLTQHVIAGAREVSMALGAPRDPLPVREVAG